MLFYYGKLFLFCLKSGTFSGVAEDIGALVLNFFSGPLTFIVCKTNEIYHVLEDNYALFTLFAKRQKIKAGYHENCLTVKLVNKLHTDKKCTSMKAWWASWVIMRVLGRALRPPWASQHDAPGGMATNGAQSFSIRIEMSSQPWALFEKNDIHLWSKPITQPIRKSYNPNTSQEQHHNKI